MGKKGKHKKHKNDTEICTEEEYEEYLKGSYGLEFIAGYTEGGMPYGLPVEEDDDKEVYKAYKTYKEYKSSDTDEDLPF